MEASVVDDFDSFVQTVFGKITHCQVLEEENADMNTELDAALKTIDRLRQLQEKKDKDMKVMSGQRLLDSQELTQRAYEGGKVIRITEQATRLKYELDVANSATATLRKEISLLRTENERLRKGASRETSRGSSVAPPGHYGGDRFHVAADVLGKRR